MRPRAGRGMGLKTPYYSIDERKLLRNMKLIERVRARSGAKVVLALKCFSTWAVFGLMRRYMDGTTSSSLFEARLGREKFGKEVHAYCVAWTRDEIRQVRTFADKIVFNSLSQLEAHAKQVRGVRLGLRVNPGISYSHFDLADPARRFSRLGVADDIRKTKAGRPSALCRRLAKQVPEIGGVMFHFNCENDDFENFAANLDALARAYAPLLDRLDWVSLGGGLCFTQKGYPLGAFCAKLKEFAERFGVQVYLEPGEAAITNSAELVTTVLDVVRNKMDIAIVDASAEAHMLDLLVYREEAEIAGGGSGPHRYLIAGRSCLAGDVFGVGRFKRKLRPGSVVRIADAAGYTMVKKNWFNGLAMPAIVVRRLDGRMDTAANMDYKDFLRSLS